MADLPAGFTPEEVRHYFENLRAAKMYQVGAFNQSIVAISGGAIALSVTFLDKIAGTCPRYSTLLYISWLLLIVSIGALIVSLSMNMSLLARAAGGEPIPKWLPNR